MLSGFWCGHKAKYKSRVKARKSAEILHYINISCCVDAQENTKSLLIAMLVMLVMLTSGTEVGEKPSVTPNPRSHVTISLKRQSWFHLVNWQETSRMKYGGRHCQYSSAWTDTRNLASGSWFYCIDYIKNVWKSDKRWEPVKFQVCQVLMLIVGTMGHTEQLLFSCLSRVVVGWHLGPLFHPWTGVSERQGPTSSPLWLLSSQTQGLVM